MEVSQKEIFALFYEQNAYTQVFVSHAVEAAYGEVRGKKVYALCQNGEAFSISDCKQVIGLLKLAAQTGHPVVTFYHSSGAKVEQGLEILQQTAQVTQTIGEISGVVPQIAVVLGVCGATAAMQAACADLCIMAKQGQMFLTPPFVSAASGVVLEGAGSADFAQKAGVAAAIYDTVEQTIAAACDLVMLLPSNNLDGGTVLEFSPPEKPLHMQDYCRIRAGASLIDHNRDFELYPQYGKKNSYTALGTICGVTVGVVATSDRYLEPQSAEKIARFVRLCDSYSIPVLTLVHTNGFVKDSAEDLAGGIRQAARLAATYADATTPKIAILAGKVIGSIYGALCCADLTIAVEGCVVAPLEPQAAVEVLYHQQANSPTPEEYAANECSAQAALQAGIAQLYATPETLRSVAEQALEMVLNKRAKRMNKKHGNMAL